MFNFKFCYTFIINVYNLNVTSVMLDLRGFSACVQVDCDKEDREENSYAVVQGVPGLTPDFGCLLDPIWGAPTGLGLPFDFMLFWSLALGACCCVLPTGEGRAAVWLHADHSCSSCRFMGLV